MRLRRCARRDDRARPHGCRARWRASRSRPQASADLARRRSPRRGDPRSRPAGAAGDRRRGPAAPLRARAAGLRERGTAARPRPATHHAGRGRAHPDADEPGFPSPPPGAVVLAREAGTRALGLADRSRRRRARSCASRCERRGPGATRARRSLVAVGHEPGAPGLRRRAATRRNVADAAVSADGRVRLGARSYALHAAADASTLRRLGDRRARRAVWNAPEDARVARAARRRARRTCSTRSTRRWRRTSSRTRSAAARRRSSSARSAGTARRRRAGGCARAQDPPIQQPVPFWAAVTDARVLGAATVARQAGVDRLVLRPDDAGVVRGRGSTRRPAARSMLGMTAVAHFMHHVYGPFDAPFELRPPPAA